jgi:glucose-1-phosphate adenylyltransferase
MFDFRLYYLTNFFIIYSQLFTRAAFARKPEEFMKKIIALVLAGGRVNELGVLTIYRPKSAVPFGGIYRVIDFPLSNLMHSGINKIGILSQYRSSSLINHIETGASWDFTGRNRGAHILPPFKGVTESDWYLGTADAVYQNLNFIEDNAPDLVLILSGDHVYRMDYQALIQYHLEKDADMTAVFKQVPLTEASRFGIARLSEEDERGGKLTGYSEKPDNPASPWASLTIYLFKTDVLIDALNYNHQNDTSFHIGKDVIPRLIQKYRVHGYKFSGYWGYTQTIEEYWQTHIDLLDRPEDINLREWLIRTNLSHRDIRDRVPTKIAPTGRVSKSLVHNGCVIEGEVEHSILFPGVHVAKGARITDSIVMFDAVIGENSKICRSILNPDVQIGENAIIGMDPSTPKADGAGITVIGEKCRIPAATRIGKNCTIYPDLSQKHFTDLNIKSGTVLQ